MSDPYPYPDPPTRIVEPVASPEVAVPTPAVCVECTNAGNEALAASARRGRKATAEPPQSEAEASDSEESEG